ncbi:hypothetical protein O0I10_011534 [Lichtheimia ornata]|uniref:F-box domain-containing protein n=1 Tax=Lichtheimia ornata TaxID=688661 RepID=A0AAD7UT81_9FUNG|nr:uncharacterized protein O0I10_011534 [Lichtheimia ornata]KAJ8652795.1 hypothetical protein O0I10_011534 [Lichtheimia ornata]
MIETDIDILCPARSAVFNDNPSIDEEIKDLTTHVREHVQKLLSTLNARASLLRNAERFELALNDAIAMINIAPSSPLGYLRAGDIASLRGQHASAIEMYDYGLERSPKSHPHYEQLVKAREAAYSINNKRIDFISRLPLDIVMHNIIPRMLQGRNLVELGKPCNYLDVSRSWRQRLALVNGLEYEVGPEDLSADGFERVYDMAPFMRSLTVDQSMREILSKMIRRRGNFRMLKKLHIYESTARGHASLLSSLRSLSNTLTELEIEYGYHTTPKQRYRLCDLLDACPNLVSISVGRGDIDMSSVTKTYPKLIKLALRNRDPEVNEGNVSSLLQPFPQLRVLKLLPVSGSEIFSAIDQHCPLLQHLILSSGPVEFPDILHTPERTGLRALSVPTSDYLGRFKEDDMVQYLVKHSETIEAFDVGEIFGFYTPNDLLHQAASQQVTFKQLRRISYPGGAEEGLVSFILWIIQHAPHLESIDTVAGPHQTRIMQELCKPTYSHLKRLGMRGCYAMLEEEERLIQHHLELREQSSLKEMKIDIFEDTLDDIPLLSVIPGLKQLTTLELYTEHPHYCRSWELIMSQLAEGCPALEQLTVSTNTSRPLFFNDINHMSSHRNLKRIVINAFEMCGDVLQFRERFKDLESFHLNIYKYHWSTIDLLENGAFHFVFSLKKPGTLFPF